MEPFAHRRGKLPREGPRAVEVPVEGDRNTIVRRREADQDLVAGETTV